jgi:hypothetical protein
MESHPQVGIAGSQFEDESGKPWPYTFRFPTIWSELDDGLRLGVISKLLARWNITRRMPEEPSQADWMPGASIIVRRDTFEQVGCLDESYFLYYEETDFFLAAKRAGWLSWYVPSSRVFHYCGKSTGVTGIKSLNRRPKYWFDSRQRYFLKNHGRLYTITADVFWMVGYTILRIRSIIQGKKNQDPKNLYWDFIANSLLSHYTARLFASKINSQTSDEVKHQAPTNLQKVSDEK